MGNAQGRRHGFGPGRGVIRCASGRRRGLLLTTALGLGASFLASQADAQVIRNTDTTTTTTYHCTTNVSPFFVPCLTVTSSSSSTEAGANTGFIAADVASQQVAEDIEDIRKKRLRRIRRRRLGYADEADGQGSNTGGTDYDAAFNALAYAPTSRAPLYMKSEPAESDVERAWWVTGTFDYENQAGTFHGSDIGMRTLSGSGHYGVDYTWTLSGDENYFTLGFFGGLTESGLRDPTTGATALTTAPNGGFYLMWFFGNFSADVTSTTTIDINSAHNVSSAATTVTTGGIGTCPVTLPTCLSSTTTTMTLQQATALATAVAEEHLENNIHYKYDLGNNWWFEPTAGLIYQHLFESQGINDQDMVRLQGGAELGRSWTWGTATVEETIKGLAYSDVFVTRQYLPVLNIPIGDDQGQVWGKGIIKWNIKWTEHFSTSLEASLYGTRGTQNIIGTSDVVEFRYTW